MKEVKELVLEITGKETLSDINKKVVVYDWYNDCILLIQNNPYHLSEMGYRFDYDNNILKEILNNSLYDVTESDYQIIIQLRTPLRRMKMLYSELNYNAELINAITKELNSNIIIWNDGNKGLSISDNKVELFNEKLLEKAYNAICYYKNYLIDPLGNIIL